MPNDHDISSQLKSISMTLKTVPTRTEPNRGRKSISQLTARLEEGESFAPGSWIEFRPINPEKRTVFNNSLHLFSQMKDALRKLTGDHSWSIRYASQIRRENMPFLHSSNTRCIMFDPFMAFRDPVREFSQTKVFLWQIFESNSYYFKTQQESRNVSAELEMLNHLNQTAAEGGTNEL